MKISENTKYLLLFLVTLLTVVLLFVEVIFPLQAENTQKERDLQLANARLAQLQTFAGQNQDYEALAKLQNLKLAEAKKKLPDYVTVPELMAEYSKLADVNGVKLESIQPSKISKENNIFVLPLKITVSGDYFKMVEFLQQIETGTRFVTLRGASFNGEKAGNIKTSADFVVYSLQGNTPATKNKGAAVPKVQPPK